MAIVELKVPVIGESVTEVTLSQWLKEEGDMIELDEPICEFESDKATLEFPSEAAGKLIYVASEGDDLEIGALVARIDTEAAGEAPAEKKEESTPTEAAPPSAEIPAAAAPQKENYATGTPSPAAAKIMREKGVDAASVNGSGRDGRITKADAQRAEPTPAPAAPPATSAAKPTPAPQPAANFSREQRTEKMSRMRRTIATRLVKAKNETAMLTTFNEVDLSEVMALRKRVQERFVEKNGVKLGFMSLFAKACAKVLMDMPNVNAQLGESGKELIYHDFVDISFAISTPTGLVVPPVKNVESLSFADVEHQLKTLAKKARGNELTIEEMQGGTFTITNGGVFGSMMSTPIINEPQSAILGMHNIIERPVAVNGEVVIRPMMYIALSYDHRVIDGSSSVTFLVKVKELLENPDFLMLGV